MWCGKTWKRLPPDKKLDNNPFIFNLAGYPPGFIIDALMQAGIDLSPSMCPALTTLRFQLLATTRSFISCMTAWARILSVTFSFVSVKSFYFFFIYDRGKLQISFFNEGILAPPCIASSGLGWRECWMPASLTSLSRFETNLIHFLWDW